MKQKKQIARTLCKNNSIWAWPSALFTLLVLSRADEVPPAIMSQSPSGAAAPTWQRAEPSEFEIFNPAGNPAASAMDQPFRFGLVTARPHLLYRFLYADGLQLSPGNQQNSFINEISPGISFDIGTHWLLDYTPTLRFYSNHRFSDELDHSVILSGGTTYEDWTFGVSQSYVSSSAPLVETGGQSQQETYSTKINASYAFNSKISLDMGLYQNLQSTENLQNSRDWSTLEWLNYQFWPRLNVGLGAGFGYVSVDSGPNQTYEQYSGRINWRATDKISFQINGGLEDRQFLDSGAASLLSPTFGASIQYQPLKQTRISLNASRSVAPSVFQDQVTENTSINCNVNQRLLGKLNLDLNAGYNMAKYLASTTAISTNRTDNYYTLSARLSRPLWKRGTVAILYQYSNNASTTPGFTYASSQVGFEFGYKF